jgi:pimeloyl-ACP methyl ester carboxylesterase
MPEVQREVLQLADGRVLAWRAVGAPSGWPVLHFHGGLSSSLEITFAHELCMAAGLRWICADRPGVGASTHVPLDSLVAIAEDVRIFADHLGLDRFDVSGWSAGVPWAIACARALPERVRRVVTIAGVAPLRPGDVRRFGLSTDRFLFRSAGRARFAAAAWLALLRRAPLGAVRRLTGKVAQDVALPSKALDARIDLQARCFVDAIEHDLRGTITDYSLLARDWSDIARSVSQPVEVWHGERDALCRIEHGERLAVLLPDARLRRVPEAGHFLPWDWLVPILEHREPA